MLSSAIVVELIDALQCCGRHVIVCHRCRAHRRSAMLWPSCHHSPSLQNSQTFWSSYCVLLPSAIIVELMDVLQCRGRQVAIRHRYRAHGRSTALWSLCRRLPSFQSSRTWNVLQRRGYRITVHGRLSTYVGPHTFVHKRPSIDVRPSTCVHQRRSINVHPSMSVSVNASYIYIIFVLIHTLT
jgi:hypothetical protein